MTRVFVVEPFEPPQDAEFDYLFRLRHREIAAVADDVVFARHLAGNGVSDEDLVLEVSSERVLVLRRTIEAMVAAIRGGAVCVTPFTLAEVNAQPPVYTLRGFEEEESRWLRRPTKEERAREALGPLTLWKGKDWKEGVDGTRVATVRVGLVHEFIDYYGETRSDVVPFIPTGAREILEIGCAKGLTGEYLQSRLGCRVTGVELNPVVAEEARKRLWKVVVGDVERVPIEGTFDVVLALELFEHLRDPFLFLERAKGWLRPGGVLILSTPNVGHWSVVWDLLQGRWDYLPIGLLCFTHLRFFTRKSLETLLHLGGWDDVVIYPQETGVPREIARALRKVKGVDWESLGISGFWVIARKNY
ncbi:class I SAM-dependent methyltransferase [Thermoanaerobaculum aquaticum]|uniref:class I SAM-dependent methyltransferase n=1 Tax=Thermoanaerobaculum aquaticum TaxID=1312852 RepID=UPI00126840A6|nr:class I SAM-dependent methyltransferase [Thermoanaerobaculum aquaticum]